MSPSEWTFLRHDAQESGKVEVPSGAYTIEETGAGQSNMTLQPAGDITEQSHRLAQFVTSDAGNRGGLTGVEQYFTALTALQRPSPLQHPWQVHTTHARDTATTLNGTPAAMFSQPLEFDHASNNYLPPYGPVMAQSTPLPVPPTPNQSWDHHHPENPRSMLAENQDQYQPRPIQVGSIHLGQDGPIIGVIFANGRHACVQNSCTGTTFGRQAEFNRHYRAKHDPHKPSFWCHIPSCEHSELNGGIAFHRRDKFREHMRDNHDYYLD